MLSYALFGYIVMWVLRIGFTGALAWGIVEANALRLSIARTVRTGADTWQRRPLTVLEFLKDARKNEPGILLFFAIVIFLGVLSWITLFTFV